jgi:acid phosphatase
VHCQVHQEFIVVVCRCGRFCLLGRDIAIVAGRNDSRDNCPITRNADRRMKIVGILAVAGSACIVAACASEPVEDESNDLGIAWVRDSAEYQAVSRQVFRVATMALPQLLADTGWSALPGQANAGDLPPAIILDVDETSLTNPIFQASFERPFSDQKLDDWSMRHAAVAVPGAREFLKLAVESGVSVFFVTNRPCVAKGDDANPCPQKKSVIDDLVEAGLPANEANVSLSGEQPDWGKEKQTRRDFLAKDYRVIMLFGDDLSDFIPCVRSSPAGDCTEAATASSRLALMQQYDDYWGAGWYVLPNPMHGSWTSFR